MLVVLYTAICYSLHFSEKMIVCYSNITTNILESLPGIWGKGGVKRQWLVHELESALVIICGELQSNYWWWWGVLSISYIVQYF